MDAKRWKPRVKRWARNIFCAMSLLVFVGSVTLAVRSYFVADQINYLAWRVAPPNNSSFGNANLLSFGYAQATFAVDLESFQARSFECPSSVLRHK
jgi:hypothetical protein